RRRCALPRPRPAVDAGRAGDRLCAVSCLLRREAATRARQPVAPGWGRRRGGRLDRRPLYPRGRRCPARSARVAVTARLVVAGVALDGADDAIVAVTTALAAAGAPIAARGLLGGDEIALAQALAARGGLTGVPVPPGP